MSRRVPSLSAPKMRSWSTAAGIDTTIRLYMPGRQVFFGVDGGAIRRLEIV
jgi:hypothetical protein